MFRPFKAGRVARQGTFSRPVICPTGNRKLWRLPARWRRSRKCCFWMSLRQDSMLSKRPN